MKKVLLRIGTWLISICMFSGIAYLSKVSAVYGADPVSSAKIEEASFLEPGKTYIILNAGRDTAVSSQAGNQWGSGFAGIKAELAEEETLISASGLEKCFWVVTEEGYLINQDTVYLNADIAILKPSPSTTTSWEYTSSGRLVNNKDYALYWNGTQFTAEGNYSGSVYAVYIYKVINDVDYGEHVHSYTSVVTPATCLEDGYTTYTCSCGDTYTDDIVPALGHDWTDWTFDHSSYEYQHYRSCKRVNNGFRCDAFEEAECEYYITDHVDATCAARGYDTAACIGCGNTVRVNYTAATGDHVYHAVSLDTGEGMHALTCEICGQSIYGECTWDAGTVIQEATADTDGIIEYECTECHDTRRETLLAGGGFSVDPEGRYLISSKEDLKLLSRIVGEGNITYSSADYMLTADIELSGIWTPIGSGNLVSGHAFTGTFDGGCHTISGMNIEVHEDGAYGLFGLTEHAKISNLAVRGRIINESEGMIGARSCAGGIVGIARESLELTGCAGHVDIVNSFSYATGSTNTGVVESYIGGLVGYMYSSVVGDCFYIKDCYADGNITNENRNEIYAAYSRAYAGGLVGGSYHYAGIQIIRDSFANMDSITVSDTMYAKDDSGAAYVYGDVILGYDQGGRTYAYDNKYLSELVYSRAVSGTLFTVGNRTTAAAGYSVITPQIAGGDMYKFLADGKTGFIWEEPDSAGEDKTAYKIRVYDYTRGLGKTDEGDLISDIDPDAEYIGNVSFSVRSLVPVIAAVRRDDGSCLRLSGEETEDGYTFSVEASSDMEIVVVKAGDTDISGNVKSKDAARIVKYLQKTLEFNDLEMLAADYDGDGSLRSKDASSIVKSLLGST